MAVNKEFETRLFKLQTTKVPSSFVSNEFSNVIASYMEDEIHWDYYDALTMSDQSVQGMIKGEASTHYNCTEKYMKIARDISKEAKKGTVYYPINNTTNPNDYSRYTT